MADVKEKVNDERYFSTASYLCHDHHIVSTVHNTAETTDGHRNRTWERRYLWCYYYKIVVQIHLYNKLGRRRKSTTSQLVPVTRSRIREMRRGGVKMQMQKKWESFPSLDLEVSPTDKGFDFLHDCCQSFSIVIVIFVLSHSRSLLRWTLTLVLICIDVCCSNVGLKANRDFPQHRVILCWDWSWLLDARVDSGTCWLMRCWMVCHWLGQSRHGGTCDGWRPTEVDEVRMDSSASFPMLSEEFRIDWSSHRYKRLRYYHRLQDSVQAFSVQTERGPENWMQGDGQRANCHCANDEANNWLTHCRNIMDVGFVRRKHDLGLHEMMTTQIVASVGGNAVAVVARTADAMWILDNVSEMDETRGCRKREDRVSQSKQQIKKLDNSGSEIEEDPKMGTGKMVDGHPRKKIQRVRGQRGMRKTDQTWNVTSTGTVNPWLTDSCLWREFTDISRMVAIFRWQSKKDKFRCLSKTDSGRRHS